MITKSQIFRIDSSHRTAGTSSAFTYTLKKSANDVYEYVACLHANIPASYYLIQDGYNTFRLNENGLQATITIPKGNYNINSFCRVVANLLSTNSPRGWTYTMTTPNPSREASTGKITITVSGNSGVQPSLVMTSLVHEQFGFVENSTNTFVSDSLTSTYCCQFQPQNVLIHSSLVFDGVDDTIQEIYRDNTGFFYDMNYILTTNEDAYAKKISNPKSNVFSFYITDDHGISLDLNGIDCHFTLLFFNKDESLKHYIKYQMMKEPDVDGEN